MIIHNDLILLLPSFRMESYENQLLKVIKIIIPS